MSPKVGRMRFSTFLRVPYSGGGVLVLPGRPPLRRDDRRTRSGPTAPGRSRPPWRARSGHARSPASWQVLGAWREDASRALPLAFLVAHLVALVRAAGDGGTTTIQA